MQRCTRQVFPIRCYRHFVGVACAVCSVVPFCAVSTCRPCCRQVSKPHRDKSYEYGRSLNSTRLEKARVRSGLHRFTIHGAIRHGFQLLTADRVLVGVHVKNALQLSNNTPQRPAHTRHCTAHIFAFDLTHISHMQCRCDATRPPSSSQREGRGADSITDFTHTRSPQIPMNDSGSRQVWPRRCVI